jgi:hypothetical protein
LPCSAILVAEVKLARSPVTGRRENESRTGTTAIPTSSKTSRVAIAMRRGPIFMALSLG